MLRITVTQSTPTSKQLKLEGRVTGPSVEELRRQCEAALGPAAGVSSMDRSRWSLGAAKSDRLLQVNGHSSVTLDLADVSFIDDDGVDLLRTLGRHNVTVARCSPFLAELLKEVLPCS